MQAAEDAPKRVCDPGSRQVGDQEEDGGEGGRVADSYDDAQFYQQLLREFLEAAGAGSIPAVPATASKVGDYCAMFALASNDIW